MYSINLVAANKAENMEPARGFKGLNIVGSTKQYLEPQLGFKGISLEANTGGGAQKIIHYRSFIPAVTILRKLVTNISSFAGNIYVEFILRDADGTVGPYLKDIVINVTISYIKDGDVIYIPNVQVTIPTGYAGATIQLDIADTTAINQVMLNYLSVTPTDFLYTSPEVLLIS